MKTVRNLVDYKQTIDEIKRLIIQYSSDTKNENYFPAYFNRIKNIPYEKDREKIEIVQRTGMTLSGTGAGNGSDCKKKAVAIAAWFQYRGIPWRLIITSKRQDKKPDHIFPQYWDSSGRWVNVDATYKRFKIDEEKTGTFFKVV